MTKYYTRLDLVNGLEIHPTFTIKNAYAVITKNTDGTFNTDYQGIVTGNKLDCARYLRELFAKETKLRCIS